MDPLIYFWNSRILEGRPRNFIILIQDVQQYLQSFAKRIPKAKRIPETVIYRWASTSGSSKEMLCFHKIKCFFSFSRLFSADSPMFETTNAFKQTFHFASNLSMSRSNHNLKEEFFNQQSLNEHFPGIF